MPESGSGGRDEGRPIYSRLDALLASLEYKLLRDPLRLCVAEVEARHFRIRISFDEIALSREAEYCRTRNEVKLFATRIARKSEKFPGAFDVRGPERVIVEDVVDQCAIMNDCVDRFRQLLPGAVSEPQ